MAKSKGFQKGQRGQGFKRIPEGDPVPIKFAPDHRLHGLEILIKRRVPAGVLLGLRSGDPARAIDPFISQIISWNLEDNGEPIPVSRAAFDDEFDVEEAFELINEWAEGVAAAVTAPLEQPSPEESTSSSG